MRNFAIIGLGQFGKCMARTLHDRGLETLVIDSDQEKVQWARDVSTKAVKADALNFALFEELIGDNFECAIVDLGDQMERSILATNYLKKLEVNEIVVEATNAAHAEILQIVGATRIVYPEQEAAERLAGLLAGRGRLDYFPVGKAFSLVEIAVPESWVGNTLADLQLRKNNRVNVVAIRTQRKPKDAEEWSFADPERKLRRSDIVLVAGHTDDIEKFTS